MSSRARAKTAPETLADTIEGNPGMNGSPTVRELLLHAPEFRRYLVAAALRALSAQKYVFDKEAKGVVWFDDSATQLKAAAFLAAYTEGLPMQTNVSLNIGDAKRVQDGDGMTLEAALRSSPALAERLRRVVDAVSTSTTTNGAKAIKQAERAE